MNTYYVPWTCLVLRLQIEIRWGLSNPVCSYNGYNKPTPSIRSLWLPKLITIQALSETRDQGSLSHTGASLFPCTVPEVALIIKLSQKMGLREIVKAPVRGTWSQPWTGSHFHPHFQGQISTLKFHLTLTSIGSLKDLGNVSQMTRRNRKEHHILYPSMPTLLAAMEHTALPQEARSASCGFHGPVRAQHRPCPLDKQRWAKVKKMTMKVPRLRMKKWRTHRRHWPSYGVRAVHWLRVLKCLCLLPTWGSMSSLRTSRLPQNSCCSKFCVQKIKQAKRFLTDRGILFA